MNTKRWGLVAVVAVAFALSMAGPAFAGGHTDGPPGLERAIAAQEAHTDALMAKAGVVGTAVGLGANGRAVVLVLTEGPGVVGIPASLDGVTVVPRVTGKIVAFGDPTDKHRPAPPGVSTGHPDITAGTIGARVTNGTDVFALSNNHVFADENLASIGDAVIQPGTFDEGASPADDFGTLADFEPIVFSTSANNVMDAAIALSSTSLLDNTTHCGWTPSSATAEATLNLKVKKCGRTTGKTDGRVDAINATVNVGYSTGTARFVNQIVIRPGKFSAGGDSGSLIVSKDGDNPVGLLFARSFLATIANPIGPVLARFGVTVDDGAAPPPPVATGTIAGKVTESDGSTAISGASVVVEGTSLSATTDSNGDYSIGNVPEGTNAVTGSADGFVNEPKTGIGVTKDTMTTVNFALAATPTGTIAGKVTKSDGGAAISGASVVVVGTSLSATTDANGDYSIGNVPTGDRSDKASATGFESQTKPATVNENQTTTVDFALAEATTATSVSVDSITYATEGGKNGDKHLLVTVALEDNLLNAVSGASVSITLDNTTTGGSWLGSGTTGTGGTVTFTLKNFPSGTYTTTVTDVTAQGLAWDEANPPNSFPE